MENKILNIKNSEQLATIKKGLDIKNTFLVELDGSRIFNIVNYISVLQYKMKFPSDCSDNLDRYNDWIRDLMWIKENSIVIIIYDYEKFMIHEKDKKEMVIYLFEECILPFWEEEVERVVVGGKTKKFNVYLVD